MPWSRHDMTPFPNKWTILQRKHWSPVDFPHKAPIIRCFVFPCLLNEQAIEQTAALRWLQTPCHWCDVAQWISNPKVGHLHGWAKITRTILTVKIRWPVTKMCAGNSSVWWVIHNLNQVACNNAHQAAHLWTISNLNSCRRLRGSVVSLRWIPTKKKKV